MARSPDYQRDGISLYLGDCLEILPEIGAVDAVVTDPPYGIDVGSMQLGKGRKSTSFESFTWDKTRPTDTQIQSVVAKAVTAIVWGGNYFGLPPSGSWLVWDKIQEFSGADVEMAWTNLGRPTKAFRLSRVEAYGNVPRIHPTAKPLQLMQWCLTHLPKDAKTVCDPFMGSGTTVVACVNAGLSCIGIEQDPVMFEKAKNRIDAALDTDRDSLWTAKQLAEQQRPLFE